MGQREWEGKTGVGVASRERMERDEGGRVTKVDRGARAGKCLNYHPGPRLSVTDFA